MGKARCSSPPDGSSSRFRRQDQASVSRLRSCKTCRRTGSASAGGTKPSRAGNRDRDRRNAANPAEWLSNLWPAPFECRISAERNLNRRAARTAKRVTSDPESTYRTLPPVESHQLNLTALRAPIASLDPSVRLTKPADWLKGRLSGLDPGKYQETVLWVPRRSSTAVGGAFGAMVSTARMRPHGALIPLTAFVRVVQV